MRSDRRLASRGGRHGRRVPGPGQPGTRGAAREADGRGHFAVGPLQTPHAPGVGRLCALARRGPRAGAAGAAARWRLTRWRLARPGRAAHARADRALAMPSAHLIATVARTRARTRPSRPARRRQLWHAGNSSSRRLRFRAVARVSNGAPSRAPCRCRAALRVQLHLSRAVRAGAPAPAAPRPVMAALAG